MKRALVLGASALLILALNQNAIREVGVSLWQKQGAVKRKGPAIPSALLTLSFLVSPAGRLSGSLEARDPHSDFGKRYQAPWRAAAVRVAGAGLGGNQYFFCQLRQGISHGL